MRLITGSSGMLGSAVKNILPGTGLTSKSCDLLRHDLYTYINDNHLTDVDTLIHCAAKVGGVGANMNHNQQFFTENIKMDHNVLTAAMALGIPNVVTILSTCIFPDRIEYPLTIDRLDDGRPHESNHGYAYAKRSLAYQTATFRNMTRDNWISVVPTNLYGPGDNFDLDHSHLVPALIRKAYESTLNDTPLNVWGDGTPLRQFVYISDIAEIIKWAIEEWNSDVPLMAVNTREYSIKEVVDIIAKRFEIPESSIRYDTSKPSGQHRKPAATDVDWFEFTSLEAGINKTIDWFIENYDKGTIRL